MRRTLTCLAVVLFWSLAASAAPDPTYTALRASRPDGRTIALNNFVYERDVLRFTLNGTLHLLAPVEGKTPGAVFIGQGSYELKPASPAEQHQLAVFAADDKLMSIVDQFDSAVFLGTALVRAAEKTPPVTGAADPKAGSRWDDYMKRQKKDLTTNVHVRVLQELLDDADLEPFFFAWIDGKQYPPAVLVVDPRGAESVRLAGRTLGGEQTMMTVIHDTKGGIWYSSRYLSEVTKGVGVAVARPGDAEHYLIDAKIRGSQLEGTTTITFIPSTNLRLLPVDLASKLRISEASYSRATEPATWTPVAAIQEKENEDSDAGVVFPAPLKAGEKYLLRLTYSGRDVLEDAGDGNFTVGRRTNWYPNLGTFDDMATYELRFRTPQKFQIVGVGEEVENRVEGEERIAVWKAKRPLRVAGFNYGKFKKTSQPDKESGMTVEVYTNPGTPNIIHDINSALEVISQTEGGPSFVKVDTASLAQSAMADGINTARTANMFFGPLSGKTVAITQQSQWFFGQSWPGLVYLPYVAFLNGTVRNTLGLNGAKDFVDNVGPHELAHQWWGHQVGFRSYHDEWISEGFAEFTAALVAQQTGGWNRYNDFWEKARRTIMEKPRAATITNIEAGPISQGYRLATWRNTSAYDALVYSKGAFVLHMLRMAMFDPAKGDEAFSTMMKEFASTYADRNASTRDFQRIVEKHAPASLRLTTDGKLDWFFDQWIRGTAIPKYTSDFKISSVGDGKYQVTGSITQSEVPEDFAVVMPLYVLFDKGSFVKVGSVAMVGNRTRPIDIKLALPQKPQKFAINYLHDVLVR